MHWYDYILFLTVFAVFFYVCLRLYYHYCHPSGLSFPCMKSKWSPNEKKAEYMPSPVHSSRNSSCEDVKVGGFARLSTASFFPRRSMLLKSQSKITQVKFKEVATPSQLSPIKDRSPLRPTIPYDQTFNMVDTPGFHHYSVNASACLEESYYNILQGTGIDLSCITPKLRNKSIVPCNIMENEMIDYILPNASDADSRTDSPSKSQGGRVSIIDPTGYYHGSAEEKAALNKSEEESETEGDPADPQQTPLFVHRCSIRNRDMISTPMVQMNGGIQPHLKFADFTPIHPSVTPYLRAFGQNGNETDWQDDSLSELQGIKEAWLVNFPDEANVSLNVSQCDSFQTCEDDSRYYETSDEIIDGAQSPVPSEERNQNFRPLSDTGCMMANC